MDPSYYIDSNVTWPEEITQYERKIYDLKQLIEISKGLNSTLDYNTLIDSILLTSMGQMQLLRAGIFLKRGIGFDDFVLHRNYKGFEIDHSREYELKHNSGLIRHMEKEIKCYTLDELKKEVKDKRSLDILKRLNPALIMPLTSKGSINGIMILGERIHKGPFSESEKEYLLNIGSLAGIAIHNVFLFEMATTDMMTKLKIHHFFHTTLMEEMEKCRKNNQPLSLIIADIDSFRDFNNTHGHIVGDEVLKSVARILKEHIRPFDIAARYGGEEFAVILPTTEMNDALVVAERFRSCIETNILQFNNLELSITISVGLALYNPKVDKSSTAFIERADKALYKSKREGKNRVTCA